MGCQLTKLMGDGKKSEKDGPAYMQEPPPPVALDSRLPFTPRQKFQIAASWKGISRAVEPTGITMFVKMFEKNANLLAMFQKFKDLRTQEQQYASLELQEHATLVMSTLDEGMKSMDNVDFLIDFLRQVGVTHRRLPGFKSELFWEIEKPFLEAVEETLGDRYSQNVEIIYKIAIKFIIENLVTGFDGVDSTGKKILS